MVLKSPAAMHINWPGAGGGGFGFGGFGSQRSITEVRREQDKQIEALKKILRDAATYANAKDARAKDPSLPKQNVDLKLEALIPVVRGQMLVVINANLERDLKGAIAFADAMKLKIIISGGIEAHKVADQLKAKNIPVIVGPVLRMPAKEDDPYDAALRTPDCCQGVVQSPSDKRSSPRETALSRRTWRGVRPPEGGSAQSGTI